jgi:hypothetical protein
VSSYSNLAPITRRGRVLTSRRISVVLVSTSSHLRETKKWVCWRRGNQASSELIPVFL